jgi:murein DD-endopeptidase MepM/ murein hydrolase activator NlpD
MIPAEQVSATRYGMLPVSLNTPVNNQPLPRSLLTENTSPQRAWVPTLKTISVRAGDNLSTVLGRMGVSSDEMHAIIDDKPEAKSLKNLFPGEVFTYLLDTQGKLQQLKYQSSPYESTTVERKANNSFVVNHVIRQPEIKTTTATAVINNSLFVDAQESGLSTPAVMELTKIFGWDIDLFQIQDGDMFSVVYEQKFLDGKKIEDGDILAASFTNNGKTFTAVRYTDKTGNTDYYTPQGFTMHKEFLRTPVDFARISSYFSLARKHPILNTIRAHKGIDYAAPMGTPIRAAGNGKVVFAAQKNGYGNVIEIKHNTTYSTLYAHMKGFAKGIKNGVAVKQGQIIGYVGMTGLATGPHLHYEFHVNGQYVNPLSAKLPMANPIATNEKQRFIAATRPLLAQLKTNNSTAQKVQPTNSKS